jgi:hypothetical protein
MTPQSQENAVTLSEGSGSASVERGGNRARESAARP